MKTMTDQHTEYFCHFFEHPPSVFHLVGSFPGCFLLFLAAREKARVEDGLYGVE